MACCRVNPVPNSDGWPLRTGQDFVPNHAVEGIDFTSIHMWPDNWDRTDLDFGKAWINAHLAQSRIMGKPLVLEEFGKAVGEPPALPFLSLPIPSLIVAICCSGLADSYCQLCCASCRRVLHLHPCQGAVSACLDLFILSMSP